MHTCSGNYLGHSLKYVKEKTDKVQYSLQLGDTVCAKKLSTIWRCPLFGKFFNIGLNFDNKAFFCIYKV